MCISIGPLIAGVTAPENVFAAAVYIPQKLSLQVCIYLFTTKLLTKIVLFLLQSVPSCITLF